MTHDRYSVYTGVLKLILAGASNSVPVTGLAPTALLSIYSTVYGTVRQKEQRRPPALTSANIGAIAPILHPCISQYTHNIKKQILYLEEKTGGIILVAVHTCMHITVPLLVCFVVVVVHVAWPRQ